MKYLRVLSPKRMAQDLQEDKIGKNEFYLYGVIFLVSIVLSALMMGGVWDAATMYRPEFLYPLEKILGITVSLGTILLAYIINKKGDGKRFWYRYVSLGVPVGILLGAIGLVVFLVAALFKIISIEFFGYPDLVLLAGLYGLGIFMTWKYMTIAASKKL